MRWKNTKAIVRTRTHVTTILNVPKGSWKQCTSAEFYENPNTFHYKNMFQQNFLSSSVIQYKAMEVEFIINRIITLVFSTYYKFNFHRFELYTMTLAFSTYYKFNFHRFVLYNWKWQKFLLKHVFLKPKSVVVFLKWVDNVNWAP